MSREKPLLPDLRKVAEDQKQLLLLALLLASGTAAEYRGVHLSFRLGDLQRRTSTVLAMAAGQSLETLVRTSEETGLAVRDMYPVARSAVESFINAAFLLAETEAVSKRALDHVPLAHWRHLHRRVGSGKYSIELRSKQMQADDAASLFPEFVGKGKSSSWTALDVPSRVNRLGSLAGDHVAARLLAAYAIIYSLSSEVTHGSLFGASYFFGLHRKDAADIEAFRARTQEQIEDILIAVLHAQAGYLAAFFGLQAHTVPIDEEVRIYERLRLVATSDDVHGHTPFVFTVHPLRRQ